MQDQDLNLEDECSPDATLCRDSRDPFNDLTVKVHTFTQVSSSGGSLLRPKARAALRADRSRPPFQVSFVHFRPMWWPKGSDFGLQRPHHVSPFQRPVEGQALPPPRPTEPRQPERLHAEDSCKILPPSSLSSRPLVSRKMMRVPQVEIQKHVRSTAATRHKTNGSAWFLRNLVTHLDWSRT